MSRPVRRLDRRYVPSRAPDFRSDVRSTVLNCHAGASPGEYRRHCQSEREDHGAVIGHEARSDGVRDKRRLEQRASRLRDRKPREATPSEARSTLSISNCESRRLLLTPSAMRTAISRRRVSARASRRFATLAQAMSSTISVTPPTQTVTFDMLPLVRAALRENGCGECARLSDRDRRQSFLFSGINLPTSGVCLGEIGIRCGEADVGFAQVKGYRLRPADVIGVPPLLAPVGIERARITADWDVCDRWLLGPEPRESGGRNADNGVDQRADAHGSTKRVVPPAELRLPKTVSEDSHRRAARNRVFGAGEVATERRRCVEEIEETRGNRSDLPLLRVGAAADGEIDRGDFAPIIREGRGPVSEVEVAPELGLIRRELAGRDLYA